MGGQTLAEEVTQVIKGLQKPELPASGWEAAVSLITLLDLYSIKSVYKSPISLKAFKPLIFHQTRCLYLK